MTSDRPLPESPPATVPRIVSASVERVSPAEGWAIVRVAWPDGVNVLVRASRKAATWRSPVDSLAERLENLAAATEVIAEIVPAWQRDEYVLQAQLLAQAANELRSS